MDRSSTPFSVYLYFLKPDSMKGREVIFVRGQNDGKMIAHERRDSFMGKFGSVWLRPDGAIAMKGNRYPITEIGLETLVVRLIEKGTRDKQNGVPEECMVEFRKNAKINDRVCTHAAGLPSATARLLRLSYRPDLHRRRIQRADPIRGLQLAQPPGRRPRVDRGIHVFELETQRRVGRPGFRSQLPRL